MMLPENEGLSSVEILRGADRPGSRHNGFGLQLLRLAAVRAEFLQEPAVPAGALRARV
jgi:hypothetical protein